MWDWDSDHGIVDVQFGVECVYWVHSHLIIQLHSTLPEWKIDVLEEGNTHSSLLRHHCPHEESTEATPPLSHHGYFCHY